MEPMALGPIIGGLAIGIWGEKDGVRLAFVVALILAIIAAVMQQKMMEETLQDTEKSIYPLEKENPDKNLEAQIQKPSEPVETTKKDRLPSATQMNRL